MKERDYNEVLDFFKNILKNDINGGVRIFNKEIDGAINNDKAFQTLKKWNNQQYNDLLIISNLNKDVKSVIFRLFQNNISSSFYYFFKRLEEGENIEQGERINFELTAVNENTGQRTKLISANPDEDKIDNDFQEWIMENCSKID